MKIYNHDSYDEVVCILDKDLFDVVVVEVHQQLVLYTAEAIKAQKKNHL